MGGGEEICGRKGRTIRIVAVPGAGSVHKPPQCYTPFMLLLLACHASTPEKNSGDTPQKTPDFDVELVQEWLQSDLPQAELLPGAQPGVALGDLDGDGWLDALMAYGGGSVAFKNDGSGFLVEEKSWTLDGAAFPGAAAVALADVDGDGDLDGELGRWGAEDLLFYNDGSGHFTSEVLAGSEGSTFSAAFADLDGDRDLDLALSAGSSTLSVDQILAGNQTGDPNLVYLNEKGHFRLLADALPKVGTDGITFQLAPLDADEDGDMDLYSANDAGPYITSNHLLLNDGTAHFTDAPDSGANLTMFAMGAGMGDANQDGLLDIYLSNVGSPRMLLGQGGGLFAEAAETTGTAIPPLPESLISWGTAFVDLDADMDQDIVITFGRGGDEKKIDAVNPEFVQSEEQPSQILASDGNAYYSRADVPGFQDPEPSRAVAIGDLDRDGRPDFVTAGKHFLRQWHTVGGFEPGITLLLRGSPENPQGIGAKIEVQVGDRTRTTWALFATTASSSAPECYLGLSENESATVRVTWPDGQKTEEVLSAGTAEMSAP